LNLGEVAPPAGFIEGFIACTGFSVDELADDVRVARVLGCLGDHPDEQDA
jgi:hypothetical protein